MNHTFFKHEPNPFDFVPFGDTPITVKSVNEWQNSDKPMSGYLVCRLKALTPVHTVGIQETESQNKISKSCLFRRGDKYLIPGSSVKGMLRKFIEAACHGWVSEITPYYLIEKNHRDLPFLVLDEKEAFKKDGGEIHKELKNSLNEQFVPQKNTDGRVDLSSFIFGHIPNKGAGWKSRVQIDGVEIHKSTIKEYKVPDIMKDAFMGRPNPSAKSWWYHKPYGIWKTKKRNYPVLYPIGNGFWGRKFYYHQDPEKCVKKYINNTDWQDTYEFDIECLNTDCESEDFRIYFDEIPLSMLFLIIWALRPHEKMRHKLGYGKAYGYGSVEFTINDFKFRPSGGDTNVTVPDDFNEYIKKNTWDSQELTKKGINDYLHIQSVMKLFQILYYEKPLTQIFLYPPFTSKGFQKILSMKEKDIENAMYEIGIKLNFKNNVHKLTPANAYKLAERLYDKGVKSTLHFGVYQDKANGYSNIIKRSEHLNL